MRQLALLAALCIATAAPAQWTLLDSHSTADFRGIDNVGHGIVWVSGSQGTILRSIDNGAAWQHCTTPPGAEKLDFRGIQAFDANTAVAMSSGTGAASRLYETTDGCHTWTLLFENPDPTGFFDDLRAPFRRNPQHPWLLLLGDPVDHHFRLWDVSPRATKHKAIASDYKLKAMNDEAIFAASNSSLFVVSDRYYMFGTGSPTGSRLIRDENEGDGYYVGNAGTTFADPPVGGDRATSGVFSIALKTITSSTLQRWWRPFFRPSGLLVTNYAVAVGGDYQKPDDATDIAAYCADTDGVWSDMTWHPAQTQPHGYRSAVAYDAATKTWFTVGPNGTDISTDDGRNWRALTPSVNEPADANKNWNALSLPFVAGPHGRIGILKPEAVRPPSQH